MTTDPVIHVVDDDEAMRASIAFLLDSDGLASRTYDSAASLLSALPLTAGCIVTDVRMPKMNGLELTRALKRRNVPLPVVMITGHGDVVMAVEAMKEGVVDFLEKPFDDEALLASVRRALDQNTKAGDLKIEGVRCRDALATLSSREQDVLAGLIAGKQNKVIAFDLGISPRTVEIYRANVMTKTGAGSLSVLVRMALLADLAD